MKLIYSSDTVNAYSNFEDAKSGNHLLERNMVVIPHEPAGNCFIKTSIGFQTVIVDITREQAAELIAGTSNGINLKD